MMKLQKKCLVDIFLNPDIAGYVFQKAVLFERIFGGVSYKFVGNCEEYTAEKNRSHIAFSYSKKGNFLMKN